MTRVLHTRTGRLSIVLAYLLALTWLLSSLLRACPMPQNIRLYLSFDDGPSAGTPFIDSIARGDSVAVNVFIVGSHVLQSDSLRGLYELYRRNALVEVGNHSFSHAGYRYRRYYRDPAAVLADFLYNDSLLHFGDAIARLPGRNAWRLNGRRSCDLPDAAAAADSLYGKGYRVFGWDMEWRGRAGGVQTAETMLRRLQSLPANRSFTPGHIVVLCHDSLFGSAPAAQQLHLFIQKARALYSFERLNSYPGR